MSQDSRDLILARVRAAIGTQHGAPSELDRAYSVLSDADLDLFTNRLQEYGARTWRAPAGEPDETVRTALASEAIDRVVVPGGIPNAWVTGLEILRDSPELDAATLDLADGVVTTCAVAIAQTGTIVLDGSAGMGRRILSLVPDRLLCVVRADQLVGSVPEAISRLDPNRPLTFVSGPSATVDIEMVRVAGVHGPRQLAVVIAS